MIPHGEERGNEWALRCKGVYFSHGWHPAILHIRDGRFVAVRDYDDVPAGIPIVEAGERLVLPGIVETHAHINDPGRADWEGFETATRAAAAGGITTLIDMPLNSSPVTTTVAALRQKQEAAAGRIMVDVGFHAGVIPGTSGETAGLIAAGVCGFKAFLCHSGIDEFPNATEADLRAVLPLLAQSRVPLLVHAELLTPGAEKLERRFAAHPRSYRAYLQSRPVAWEIAAIRLLIDLCREYRTPVHIVHLAAALEARPLIVAAKAEGLPLTVETCPHYLYFAAEEVPDGDTRFKCAPPIRGRQQRITLRVMAAKGEIDTLGSDHSPAPPKLKHLDTGNLRYAWGGIASLQLLLPSAWTALKVPERVVAALTSKPAELAGLADRKGSIAPGKDADFVLFDSSKTFVVREEDLQHRHKATPYSGRTLDGVVEATYLRGRCIFEHGRFPDAPAGRLLTRSAS